MKIIYEKKCSGCAKRSYSSCPTGLWICPYCNKDITRVKAKEANHKKIAYHKKTFISLLTNNTV